MTESLALETGPRFPYLAEGSRYADRLVRLQLAGGTMPEPAEGDGELAMSAATFLAHMLFLHQMARGADPHQAGDLLPAAGRGAGLARQFLGAGTVEICCDYCGGLMVFSLAAAAAGQLDGPAAWDGLARAIIPPATSPEATATPLPLAPPHRKETRS